MQNAGRTEGRGVVHSCYSFGGCEKPASSDWFIRLLLPFFFLTATNSEKVNAGPILITTRNKNNVESKEKKWPNEMCAKDTKIG